jgi:hypothetical protein
MEVQIILVIYSSVCEWLYVFEFASFLTFYGLKYNTIFEGHRLVAYVHFFENHLVKFWKK